MASIWELLIKSLSLQNAYVSCKGKLPIHKMTKWQLVDLAIKEGVDREEPLGRLTKDELAEKIYQKRNA